MKFHNWQARQKEFKIVSNNKAKCVALSYIKQGMKILDVGCGDSDFFDTIKKKMPSCELHVFDVEREALAIAKKKGYIAHSSLDINEKFDVITLFEVFEHLTIQERIAYAEKFDRMLRKGGRLILSFPHVKSFLSVLTYFDNQDHKAPYVKVIGLTYLFENFKRERVFYFAPYINPLKVLLCLATGLHWNAVFNDVGVVLKKEA